MGSLVSRTTKHTEPGTCQSARRAISNAVHAAVTEISGDTGAQRCHQYALAGCGLLNILSSSSTGARPVLDSGSGYIPQAGSLWLVPNPHFPNLTFCINALNGGILRSELHCWIVNRAGLDVIDFSARHFPALCLGSWSRPVVDYMWTTSTALPEYYMVSPELQGTEWLYRRLSRSDGLALTMSAAKHYFED